MKVGIRLTEPCGSLDNRAIHISTILTFLDRNFVLWLLLKPQYDVCNRPESFKKDKKARDAWVLDVAPSSRKKKPLLTFCSLAWSAHHEEETRSRPGFSRRWCCFMCYDSYFFCIVPSIPSIYPCSTSYWLRSWTGCQPITGQIYFCS